MKLCSLYIENFGALSQYSLTFNEGVTVVQEPNGFGKTTLAEFIRAMFYGFPRKAKTLDKSKRQKYTPWNGGKFGGNLVFEHQGQRYRIERTFGATPKGDTFTLIDLTTNKKSTRFSEEIGLELFQLDADSFERSTYMPQQPDSGSLTTDSIQAKLADLVEDRGDVGNYDNAVAALKAARSTLIPYRGNGGAVAQAQSEISRLQEALAGAAGLRDSLDRTEQEITRLETEREDCRKAQTAIRERILRASEAAAVAAVHQRHARLTEEENRCQQALEALKARYPGGVPGEEQLAQARQAASNGAALALQTVTTPEDEQALRCIEENGHRFEGRIPTREQLESCRERISAWENLRTEAENTGLSDGERDLYGKLLPMEEAGAFRPERLETLEKANRELLKARHELDGLRPSEEEARRLAELKNWFGSDVPTRETLLGLRQDLAKAGELRKDKEKLLARMAAEPEHRASPVPVILLAVLALAAIAAGALLLKQLGGLAWGMLGVGAVCLVGAVIAGIRLADSAGKERQRAQQLQAELNRLDADVSGLEEKAAAFARRYTRTLPLSEALHEIRANWENLVELATKAARTEEQRRQLQKKAAMLEEGLRRELGTGDFDRGIRELYLAKQQLQELRAEMAEAEEKRRSLAAEIEANRSAVSGFLGAYYESPEPAEFHSLLSDLERSAGEFLRAREQTARWQERKQKHAGETARWEAQLNAFFEEFGLTREPQVREQLMRLRDDRKTYEELIRQAVELSREKAVFEGEDREKLAIPVTEQEDPGVLRAEELRLAEQIEGLSARIVAKKQQHRETGEALSRVPALRDELEQYQEKKNTDQKKAKLLDETMVFLEKARENLQNSYLGPVREAFGGYMERLLGEKAEQILLTPDLDVQLERAGQARELAYFSAGQTDTVMLCMRMALVDALFRQEKPCVILDDPFVNLDDNHTAEALDLLRELAKDRQILYLVCNSSRNF